VFKCPLLLLLISRDIIISLHRRRRLSRFVVSSRTGADCRRERILSSRRKIGSG